MIYEINHKRTAEMKWKWRNDQKKKKNQDFNGVWTRDLAIPISYEATDFFFFFFQASLRSCINYVHCDEHFFIFISFPQFIYNLFHISLTLISSTGTYESTIDVSGFIAQLVEHRTGIARSRV